MHLPRGGSPGTRHDTGNRLAMTAGSDWDELAQQRLSRFLAHHRLPAEVAVKAYIGRIAGTCATGDLATVTFSSAYGAAAQVT